MLSKFFFMEEKMSATFRKGGVHPNDKKSLTNKVSLSKIKMPEELVVAMSQHLGAPANLIKNVGDSLEIGELIGTASSFISANVHSPVKGIIKEIRKVTLASGVVCDAAVIIPDENQPEAFNVKRDYSSLNKDELLGIIKEKGIVGMGGATFPVHVKLSIPEGKTVNALIINGTECEPYLTSDHRLMLEKTDELLEGIMICSKIVSPEKIFIGIEENKMDAIEKLRRVISEKNLPIEVIQLKMKYPQGDEKQLLKAIINREIPSGKLPIDVGGVIVNAGSAFAIYQAVVFDKPLIERIVTVSGECVTKPCNLIAPIGTKVKDIIAAAEGFKEEPDKLISGGPMMGFAFFDEETPITKGSSGILAIKDQKSSEKTACLSCGKCAEVCPMGLQPTRMYGLITNGKYAEAMKINLMDCKECGCCAFSCPAHLDLVHAFKFGKKMGRKK